MSDYFLVGVNHLAAVVPCRERVTVLQDHLRSTLRRVQETAELDESVILSTCSRVEVYGVSRNPQISMGRLRRWFMDRGGEDIQKDLYAKVSGEAVRHLFRVTAGLDSWILGESEIQGQVKRAYQIALDEGCTGRVLNQMFQQAVANGKLIRAETGIQNGIHSIGGAAAMLAQKIFDSTASGKVLVFGAGEAAEAVARHLAAKNFNEIWVANRTLERAQAMALPFGGHAVSFEEGLQMLGLVEIAVFSTTSPRYLVHDPTLRPLAAGRGRPLFLIDLGLPRNVDPSCAFVPGIFLYNLDDLQAIISRNMKGKAAEKGMAEAMAVQAASVCSARLEQAPIQRVMKDKMEVL